MNSWTREDEVGAITSVMIYVGSELIGANAVAFKPEDLHFRKIHS
jgi:hypothetical protein